MQLVSPRPGSVLARLGERPRIAVLRTGRVGDLVVLTPALRALRAARPDAHICLLVNTRALPLAQRLPSVDQVVVVPDLAAMQRLGAGLPDADMIHLLDNLRGRRFDLVLQCAGGGETTNAFVLALGARLTAGQQWPGAPRLDVWMPYQRTQPDVLRLLDLMQLVGAPPGPPDYADVQVTPADDAELALLDSQMQASLAAGLVVGVAAGAGSGARCWPPERFAAVLDATLANTRLTAVLLGTAEEAPLTAAIRDRVHVPTLDLAGQISLGGLLAVLARARLLIANDSAPAHLARALDVPSVVVFGSAHPSQWAAPRRVWDRAVADETAPCRRFAPPCGCPDDSRAVCLSNVAVEPVAEQVGALLTLLAETPMAHWPHRLPHSAEPGRLDGQHPGSIAGAVGDGGG